MVFPPDTDDRGEPAAFTRTMAAVPPILTHASYDDVPYEASLAPRTHPQNAEVIARLFGLSPQPAASARVLEIGCGTGGNVLPMAYSLPGATFVGVDLSAPQVAMAKANAAMLELANVRFVCADIADFEPESAFDYIICHGVYSWVPPETRAAILALCEKALSPHGVAHISYNVLPGWHMRGAFREMLRFHAQHFPAAAERVEQARAFGRFLTEATAALGDASPRNSAYSTLLREEFELIQALPDFYVLHEHLADTNDPFSFLDFLDQTGAHGLRYLGDAAFSTMLTQNLPRETAEGLDRIAPTREALEQYRDFVVNRAFRQSLLVRAGAPVNSQLDSSAIDGLTVRASIRRQESGEWFIPQAGGASRAIHEPLAAGLLDALANAYPTSLSFVSLAEALDGLPWPPGIEDHAAHLRAVLLSLFATDAVELRTWNPEVATAIPDFPRAFRPAMVAEAGVGVPTPFHSLITLGPSSARLLPLLTGTSGKPELIAAIVAMIASGELRIEGPDGSDQGSPDAAEAVVDASLQQLMQAGLLESPRPSG